MNKPVAIVELGGEVTWLTDVLPYKAKLYTHAAPTKVKFASDSCESGWIYLENAHPVKELTDEEILDTFNPKFMCDLDDSDVIDFAKAILRKAQEK